MVDPYLPGLGKCGTGGMGYSPALRDLRVEVEENPSDQAISHLPLRWPQDAHICFAGTSRLFPKSPVAVRW